MTINELTTIRKQWLVKNHKYSLIHWSEFDYNILKIIMWRNTQTGKNNTKYNDVTIMFDTETSKKHENATYTEKGQLKYIPVENYVIAWTLSIRAYDLNVVTLWGHKPSTLVTAIHRILNHLEGYETIMYCHNLAYDWVFLRQFFFAEFGTPNKQLNTKPHYPILFKWECGLTIKDSLILAQRSLDKWSKDLNVEHTKAVGKWDYNKIRTQSEDFTSDELEYIEHDTLAGVECIDTLKHQLGKNIHSMPYTATGIPREDVRKIAKQNRGRDRFSRQSLSYEQYTKAEKVYHGGYTHANRHLIDTTLTDGVQCYDFASSYPFVMVSEKYPSTKFMQLDDCNIDYILSNAENYAFMFKLVLVKPRLKNDFVSMPALQFSKCVNVINPVCDNGRILCAEYVEIYLSEQDLIVINEQYNYDKHICTEVECSTKAYLPRWFTDYIFKLFSDKTTLKGGDKVLYALAKAKLNSLYGMCVQKSVKETVEENYITGEYEKVVQDVSELYEKYLNNHNTILPYQWGVWVTAYAFRNLFQLGKCCKTWVYSDTDSCYGIDWDKDKLDKYNKSCIAKLQANGYDGVLHNDRMYYLGVAEFDGAYSEYRVQGAKRYCGRSVEDNELHITVAGVPKVGYKCLNDNIDNFTKGTIFDGVTTGKLTHAYIYNDYRVENGIELADSIDLTPCDYLLDNVECCDWESIFKEEIEVQIYE